MDRFLDLLIRGLLWRCPVCGEGKVFCGFFKMYERCSVCNHRFEREEGYFTGAMAINLIISESIVAAITIPLAANVNIPLLPVALIVAPLAVLLPIIFYRHSRTIWMSIDLFLNPLQRTMD